MTDAPDPPAHRSPDDLRSEMERRRQDLHMRRRAREFWLLTILGVGGFALIAIVLIGIGKGVL
ncbi:MAG: hypothetical protein WA908_01625 [Pontixanthobacter sp.]